MGTEFWAGLVGAIVGSALTLAAEYIKYRWETNHDRARDDSRRNLLRQMLDKASPNGWRKLSTLAAVVGLTEEDTARLLIEIGARASESGNGAWGYLRDHPLPDTEYSQLPPN
ncbi:MULTISPECIES: hypothetical protein [unclassified Mesorhizobium]|uniref:hypothetical protein n=1 Tax=unclassified Mesorhizobium TaxID=325217 RepID=UPI003339BD42